MPPDEILEEKKPGRWNRLWEIGISWLNHPRLPLHLALLSLLLTLPALWVGWQLDDYFHRLRFLNPSPLIYGQDKILSAFSFMNGGAELNRLGMDLGILPWWTASDFRFSFLRYFSSLTLWLDYWLWPDWPSLMHLQSLLWYAALVVVATGFYRRIMGINWTAGLASLLYALDESHALSAAWLANRNALQAVFWGILCLAVHDQWRRKNKKWAAWISPACLSLALLSGETALATAGYLLSYTFFLDQGGWKKRVISLLPCGAVLFLWAVVYRSFGFGAHSSGAYIDPLGYPFEFFKAFISRAPLLLLGQWSPFPADTGSFFSEKAATFLSLTWLIVLFFILVPLIKRDRIARFWSLGMVLSLFPVSASLPSNRLLLFVGLGAMGLLAGFLNGLIEPSDSRLTGFSDGRLIGISDGRLIGSSDSLLLSRFWRIPASISGVLLVIFHLIFSPLAMPANAYSMKLVGDFFKVPIKDVPNDPQIIKQDLILVNPPDYLFSVNLIKPLKIMEGKPAPRVIRALSTGPGLTTIQRIDRQSLKVNIPHGLFNGLNGHLFRSADNPLAPGQEIHISGLSIRITRLSRDKGPEEVIYRFSVPLEDPSLRWLKWEKETYVPFIPPRIGQSVTVQGSKAFDFLRMVKGSVRK